MNLPVNIEALLEAHATAVVGVYTHGDTGGYHVALQAAEDAIRVAVEGLLPSDTNTVQVAKKTVSPAFPDDVFDAALNLEYPIPDNPHASVIQRATDNRTAFKKGWDSAHSFLPSPTGTDVSHEQKDTCPVCLNCEQTIGMSESHWIDSLVTRLPHVRPIFVKDVKAMSRDELQRRVLIGSDWQGAFARSLDGIPEISCIPGGGIDGCRTDKEVRAIVTQLALECPKTWAKTWTGQMKHDATRS